MEKNTVSIENLSFERSVIRSGNSLFVCLPEIYVTLAKIKKGGRLTLNVQEDGSLKISTKQEVVP